MNILFLTWNFPPTVGGIEAVAWHVYKGLCARGHAVQVVTRGPVRGNDAPGVVRVGRGSLPGFLLQGLWICWKLFRRGRPDVMLCSTVVGALPAWLLGALFGRPYVVLAHGSDLVRGGWLYSRVVAFLLRRAAVVCANSGNTRELVIQSGLEADRVRIIYPGVEPLPPPQPPAAGLVSGWIQSGRPLLLSVGRLIRRKGVLEFIEHALPDIVREHPEVLLVVVGEEATQSLAHHRERLRDDIVSAIGRLALSRHVVLAGRIEDVDLYALLRSARLLLMPVRPTPGDVEGFGIVFVEAALAGLPVVATRIGGIPDAVQDGVTGLLTPPGDDAAVAEAVKRLLKDEALARRLGEAGRARAQAQFLWTRIVQDYEVALAAAVGRLHV